MSVKSKVLEMEDKIIEFTQLMGSEVSPGHCVIISDVDQPCAKLVAVVTRIEDSLVYARYLQKDVANSFRREACDAIERVTPVEWFGYRVFYAHPAYRCLADPALPHLAKYPDGYSRRWQDRSGVELWSADSDSAQIAIDAAARSEQ